MLEVALAVNEKPSLLTSGWGCNIFLSLSWSECPKAVIPHGYAVRAQGDKLSYTCDEGYKLFKKGWWGEATCVNRQWSGLEQCIGKSAYPISISESVWKCNANSLSVSSQGETQCGEIPAIANGEVPAIQQPYKENDSAPIRCNEGFEAQVQSLHCHEGEWSSRGLPLNEICTGMFFRRSHVLTDHCE